MRGVQISLALWPLGDWLIWRVDNTVCDWVLRAGPLKLWVVK